MLQIMQFNKCLQESQSVISFETYEGHRVDVSKRFIRSHLIDDLANSPYWVFSKNRDFKNSDAIIKLDEVYIVECRDIAVGVDTENKPILIIKDILPYHYIQAYINAMKLVENLPRKAW